MRILITIMVLITTPVHAVDYSRTDAEMLAYAIRSCIDSLAVMDVLPDGGAVAVKYSNPSRWSRFAFNAVESALTSHGYVISDSLDLAEWSLSLDMEEFRVIFYEDGKNWRRSTIAGFYYAVMDSTGTVLKAGRISATEHDTLSGRHEFYNDIINFSPTARRSVIRHESGWLRIISFALFTGVILWSAYN